ncbi:MAG: universal stress protein, partial [Desulfovermiculus sp.]
MSAKTDFALARGQRSEVSKKQKLITQPKENACMLQTILFPTDFSEFSQQAQNVFKDLQAMGAEKVVLLHIVDQRSLLAMEHYAYGQAEEMEKKILDSAQNELEKMAQK